MADVQANPREALAALEASRRELESLTYAIGHDLRAPLRTLEGFARALSEDCGGQLDATGRRYLQHVLDGAGRLSVMLEGLLSLARIDRAGFHPSALDMTVLAGRILGRLRAAEPARVIEAVLPASIAVDADAPLLTAALAALLENAVKFTRGRAPSRVEVGVRSGSPDTYFVCDNGVGFDMRYADRLFKPFQRLCPEGDFEGVGLGLAMAHRVISRHGGRIWTEAAPGRGATFYFTLARAVSP